MTPDQEARFREAMTRNDVVPPDRIISDGKIHRFSTRTIQNDDAGWYVVHSGEFASGAYGDWRTSSSFKWTSFTKEGSSEEKKKEYETTKQKLERTVQDDLMKRQTDARIRASEIWDKAPPAKEHLYLERKKVSAYGIRVRNEKLIIPVCDWEEIDSLQFIAQDGSKTFLGGGRVKGGFFKIGEIVDGPDHPICIAEGYATTATIYKATKFATIVAFNAGNLPIVAKKMRERHPRNPILICADNDWQNAKNPGISFGREGAYMSSGLMVSPQDFSEENNKATDFNELAETYGIDAVRLTIEKKLVEKKIVAAVGDNSEWEEPGKIEAPLLAVPAFDADEMLPPFLKELIIDEADRMPCPPDFIACALIVAAGAAIGTKCAIKPKAQDDWLVIPNLWGGIVASPSAKKSPAISSALKPLEILISKSKEKFKSESTDYENNKVFFDARFDSVLKSIKSEAAKSSPDPLKLDSLRLELEILREQTPKAPILQRYKTNDSTIEKLGEILRDNPTGILVLRDELVGLIASWEREGREGERAFYLEAWNGNSSFDTDRIGRGSIFIENLCISLFGGIQPDKLIVYLELASNALSNDGMLQRFQMLVYPDPVLWEWRDRQPNHAARRKVTEVFEKLADFDPCDIGAELANTYCKFKYFSFDKEAQQGFIERSTILHTRLLPAEEHPIIAQHLAKFDKLLPALALIFHVLDCIANNRRGPVSESATYMAAIWCDYLEAHARRCYGLLIDEGLRAAQALARKVETGKLNDGFTARDVKRPNWRGLSSDQQIESALSWLCDENWLRADIIKSSANGGRPTVKYLINPAFKK